MPRKRKLRRRRDRFAITLPLTFGEGTPRFHQLAYTGGKMKIPSLGGSIPFVVDLAGLEFSGSTPILKDHNPALVIGHTDRFEVRDHQLHMEGIVSGAGPAAAEVITAAASGFPWQASIGIEPKSVAFVPKGRSAFVNGRSQTGPFYHVKQSRIFESSVVSLGADQNTRTRIAAGWENLSMTFAEYLASLGLDAATLTTEATATLQASYDAEHGGDDPDDLDQLTAEQRRIASIQEIAAEFPTIRASAISEGWDLPRVRQQVQLMTMRGNRPNIQTGRRVRHNAVAAMTAALCFSAGLPETAIAKWYGAEAMDQATSKEYREAGIHSLMFDVIEAAGMHVRPGRVTSDVIRTAYEAEGKLRASAGGSGLSTVSLQGVLGDVMHKSLLNAYEAVPSIVGKFSSETDVNDFRKHTRYRVTGAGLLERIGKGGEIKHMTLSEADYENQAKLFAKMIVLSEEDQINDDLGALMQIPTFLGRMAALTREGLVWDLILDNSDSFFSTANGNYIEGATTNLGIDGLTQAEQVFDELVDADGRPILLQPKSLIVPSALKVPAQSLMKETRVVGPTSGKSLADNPHAGKWEPLSTPYLKSKPKEWYLAADPNAVAPIELVYLRGRRQPRIESGSLDFNILGIAWRCVWALGAAKQDPKGMVMSKGEA